MSRDQRHNESSTEADDPYASVVEDSQNTLDSKKESARQRKWNQLKGKFKHQKAALKQGFMMGAMVGGGMGLVMGLYAAVQYRSIIVLPISILASAGSFGFFMACGTLIRTQDFDENAQINLLRYNVKEMRYETAIPMWQMKYMSNRM